MKSTILLTTALFLMSAPAPDAKTISEFSGGFLAENSDSGLRSNPSQTELPAGKIAKRQLALEAALPVVH